MLTRKKRAPKKAQAVVPVSGFDPYAAAFLEHSRMVGQTERTVQTRRDVIAWFVAWCAERGLDRPHDITRPILERYQRHLYHYRKADGEPLSYGTQLHRVVPLKVFFRWLVRENHILYNPASDLTLISPPKRLPRHVLTEQQVTQVLNETSPQRPQGVRDRAILEVLYSSGMRRMELCNLKCIDVDTQRGSVMIRQGKGQRDRLIPLGERACLWVERYQVEVRDQLLSSHDDGTLFLTDYGEAFTGHRLGDLVRRYVRQALEGVSGSCHLFRHACATHMLDNGADLRYIQVLLGHADLSTTQIYTQVSIMRLKAVHAMTHPARLRLEASPSSSQGAEAAATAQELAKAEREAFLGALAQEIDGDETPEPGTPGP